VVGVELFEQLASQLGEEGLLILLLAETDVEVVEVAHTCGAQVNDVVGTGFLGAAGVEGGQGGLEVDEGIAEVEGLGTGLDGAFGCEMDFDAEVGDADDVAFVEGHFGDGSVVEEGSVGGAEVMDHPGSFFGFDDDGVLSGDGAVGQEDLAFRLAADVDGSLGEAEIVHERMATAHQQTHDRTVS